MGVGGCRWWVDTAFCAAGSKQRGAGGWWWVVWWLVEVGAVMSPTNMVLSTVMDAMCYTVMDACATQ